MKERRDEYAMGQGGYKPRTTIHSVINRLFARPVQLAVSLIAVVREEFPDVSFWQGVINWAMMASKTKKIIIRAGQNVWVDTRFKINYVAAKLWGLLRGIYWFYDGRASPGAQATLLVSLIKDDLPELGIWIDWEKNFKGAHEGLKNVVAMMQEVERLLPGVQVGMYTGYWFFIENSNPIWNAAQYAYLALRKLWLAFYAALENVLIPKPWKEMTYWQKGTPPEGHEHGCESEDIDMNEDMTGEVTPPDPEPEEDMQYRVVWADGVQKRTAPHTGAGKVSVIPFGTVAEVLRDNVADQTYPTDPYKKWVEFTDHTFGASIYGQGSVRMEKVQEPDPEPGKEVTGATIRFSDGSTQEMIPAP